MGVFPVFPLLIRLAAVPTGILPAMVGITLATLALWAFVVAGWLYWTLMRPGSTPRTWLLLLAAWPYSFYFEASLTESLFAALTAVCLLALEAERPSRSGGLPVADRDTRYVASNPAILSAAADILGALSIVGRTVVLLALAAVLLVVLLGWLRNAA